MIAVLQKNATPVAGSGVGEAPVELVGAYCPLSRGGEAGRSRSSMVKKSISSSIDEESVAGVGGASVFEVSQSKERSSTSTSLGAKCAGLWKGESFCRLDAGSGACIGVAVSMSRCASCRGSGALASVAVGPGLFEDCMAGAGGLSKASSGNGTSSGVMRTRPGS